MKYGFAGDRKIAVDILEFLINRGYKPSFIIVGDSESTTHKDNIITSSGLDIDHVYFASDLDSEKVVNSLSGYDVDYIFGIHFPYIISQRILNIPKVGFLNLHPAFLPYNKGWHTPNWAILEKTKYGATLHFMSNELDSGDIIAQRELKVQPNETSNQLYQRALELEKEIFIESFDELLTLKPIRIQQAEVGTSHNKRDLEIIQEIDLNNKVYPLDFIDLLRALTTNKLTEAAYFKLNNKKYYIQVDIVESDT